MLKIINTTTPTELKWTLHGQLSGPWVSELKSNWDRARVESQGRKRIVDLTDVTFIDECGELVLRAMRSEGAEFVAHGVDTKQVLADLDSKRKRTLRKCLAHLSRQRNSF
jgi:anti-anti-sigma regulatory factor